MPDGFESWIMEAGRTCQIPTYTVEVGTHDREEETWAKKEPLAHQDSRGFPGFPRSRFHCLPARPAGRDEPFCSQAKVNP